MAGLNLFTNNAATTLASSINASVTSLSVAAGTGALFPNPAGSQYFYCTLANNAGAVEIVKVTARSTDTFTIVRGQDGTSGSSWVTGDKVELRLVNADLTNFPQLDSTNTFAQAQTFSAGITSTAVPVAIASGGTNNGSLAVTAGGVVYTDGSKLVNVGAGTAGQALLSNGSSAPTWGAAGLAWQAVQTSGFTAVAGNAYPCNTTSAAFTVTLPASASIGNQIALVDYAGTSATNNITLNPNGLKVNGSTNSVIIGQNREGITLTYIDSTQGWIAISDTYANTTPIIPGYTGTYLIAAGGAGGGGVYGGGGGGGGQVLTGSYTLLAGTTYSCTVGAGGSGTTGTGNSGSTSTFLGLTASGGVGGQVTNGGASGSGYAGGTGFVGPSNEKGGGGGGNTAVGVSPAQSAGGQAGNGGAGTTSSITGTSTGYGGGGGGGAAAQTTVGTGTDGGGNGGVAAAANLGGGGGGNHNNSSGPKAGGSGVVILSVPTSRYTGTTTGSPTISTSGANTIIKFTASGSYTA